MAEPGEHKTVQARILQYDQGMGWTYVPSEQAERRGFYLSAIAQGKQTARNGRHLKTSKFRYEGLGFT